MAKSSTPKTPFNGVINVYVPIDDLDNVIQLSESLTNVIALLSTVTAEGYKYSAAYEDVTGLYKVSLYCLRDTDPNYGHMLFANGEGLLIATAALLYKHFEVARGGSWDSVATKQTNRRFS